MDTIPNYITQTGYDRLHQEWLDLMNHERPKIVELVHWAASNGDRSENGDYLYGKKRLREIDKRIRFLTQRLEKAHLCDPRVHHGKTQIFFGATVVYLDEQERSHTVTILGVDEADSQQGQISWISPLAKHLLKAHEGDQIRLRTPSGEHLLEIIEVRYPQ